MNSDPSTNPALEQAAEDQALLQAVLDTVIDAIITIDARGIIRHVNSAACRIFGYSPEELVSCNVSKLMPAPDRDRHDGYLNNYLTTGAARIIGIGRQVEALKKDGTRFPADLAVSEVRYDDTLLFTGIVRDMTERLQAEEALLRERTLSENLFETANAVVLLLDVAGRIVRFNPFMEQLCGYSLGEVQGQEWAERFIPAHDQILIRDLFRRTLEGAPLSSSVNSILTKDGDERMIAWSGRRLFNSHGDIEGVLAIGNDITELKEAERKLIQSERLAAIGQMVAGLAHESRNALQRSRAFLDLLDLEVGDQPAQRKLVHGVQNALTELQRLYEEVRNYAAPVGLDLVECQLPELCQETWDRLQDRHQPHGVQLRLITRDPPPCCRCDPLRFQQVIRNILENALAVSPPGSEVTVVFEEAEYKGGPAVRIRIRDAGPGLSEEQRTKIFEPFFTTKTKGTGLGMAIAKRIVEAHGGEIEVGSYNSGGAEIVVILPRGKA